MRLGLLAPVVLLGVGFASNTHAHESRPAYLELTGRGAGAFEVQWRRPARGDQVLSMQPALPSHCAPVGRRAQNGQPDVLVERWAIDCGALGLVGHAIRIDGLEATLTDVLVRVALADGVTYTQILRPNDTSFVVKGQPSGWQMGADYSRLGVEHIVGGIDHLLFVLALVILVRGRRRLVATITAFTMAHSVTLAGATLGWVRVPQQPVEAAIALSIVLVAGEIVHGRRGRADITQSWPWLVALAFGLLHGFGFAGALSEVGLPENHVPYALLFFNGGVEVGQLLVIAVVLGLNGALGRGRISLPRWAGLVPPYVMGSLAMAWVIQRIAAFWS